MNVPKSSLLERVLLLGVLGLSPASSVSSVLELEAGLVGTFPIASDFSGTTEREEAPSTATKPTRPTLQITRITERVRNLFQSSVRVSFATYSHNKGQFKFRRNLVQEFHCEDGKVQ